MKKTLVSALTAALVVGAASTTFAAANPFSDVPSDHWAYDAVAQLAKDGVIDGYGDSTYRGDQNITRYEMAQMVARAMAKNDVSAADKAMIDKLAAEFSDELNNLGVRVANLEKKTDNVKWTGEARWRFVSAHRNDDGQGSNNTSDRKNTNAFLFRLEPTAQINEHWAAKARFDYTTDTNSSANANSVAVDRMWAQGQYGTTQINLGKLPFKSADGGFVFDERISGASVVFGKSVKATVVAGRFNFDNSTDFYYRGYGSNKGVYLGGGSLYNTGSMQALQLNGSINKFDWVAAYYNVNGVQNNVTNSSDNAHIWSVGVGYNFDKNFNMKAAYAKNQSSYAVNSGATKIDGKFTRAYNIEANYKGADPAKKGSFGLFVAYRDLGGAAVLATTYDAIKTGEKGWEVGGSYTFDKNIMGTLKYFKGKSIGTGSTTGVDSDQNASRFFGQVEFFF